MCVKISELFKCSIIFILNHLPMFINVITCVFQNKLLLNAVLMNVFKWEKVIDVLVEKTNILEKEKNMDPELVYVLITELMWSKFGLKGNAKNILAIKKYKTEFQQLMNESELVKLSTSIPTKGKMLF